MASLRELQESFALAMRDPAAGCAVEPLANLAIYRNNSASAYQNALAISYPVIKARVGEEYFRELGFRFRERSPSRSGDLHWAGREFADFLDQHLRGGDYAWLADLARLEWSCEEAAIAGELAHVGLEALAAITPEAIGEAVFSLQPSIRLHAFPYPLFSIWRANQGVVGAPVDQSLGNEQGLVRMRRDRIELIAMPTDQYAFISALASGKNLGDAVGSAGAEGERLTQLLGFLFAEELVVAIQDGGGLRTSS
jgi:hypothetical protein